MWLASTANYLYNLNTDAEAINMFLLKALCIWVPIVNLITISDLLRLNNEHLKTHYPDNSQLERLRKTSNAFAGLFLIPYYLVGWMGYYFIKGDWHEFLSACLFCSFGFILTLAGYITYCLQLTRVSYEIAGSESAAQLAAELPVDIS